MPVGREGIPTDAMIVKEGFGKVVATDTGPFLTGTGRGIDRQRLPKPNDEVP